MRAPGFFIVVAWLACAAPAQADTVTLVSDPWCPFACEAGSAKPGYLIEIAQAALTPLGYQVEYQNLPFLRAERYVLRGDANGLVGVIRSSKRLDWHYPALPLGDGRVCYYTRPDSFWSYRGPQSLTGQTVATIKGYYYSDEIQAGLQIAQTEAVSAEMALDHNLQKLAQNRVSTVVEFSAVMDYKLANNTSDKVRLAGCEAGAAPVYIAFSPALSNSAGLAKKISDGVAVLRKTGKLKAILAGYGLKDWQ